MSESSVEVQVKESIATSLGTTVQSLGPEVTLVDDLGADSIDMVEIQMALEEEFDIVISDEELETFNKVQDVVTFVIMKVVNKTE